MFVAMGLPGMEHVKLIQESALPHTTPLTPHNVFPTLSICYCTNHSLPCATETSLALAQTHTAQLGGREGLQFAPFAIKDIFPMLFLCLLPWVQVATIHSADACMGG